VRILRLARIIRVMQMKDTWKSTMRLIITLIYLLLWVHFTGCLWFVIVQTDEDWIPVPDWYWGHTTVFDEGEWT
jgi:hypothetical protein